MVGPREGVEPVHIFCGEGVNFFAILGGRP